MVMNRAPGRNRAWLFLLYLIFGLYLVNFPFNFIGIPEEIISSEFNKWIIFVGGILTILGGINYLRVSRPIY